ncbi:hypothetical protein [Ureibacillus thermophilus]|nr:hypothetical protein [Ureibacillus thermophilus]
MYKALLRTAFSLIINIAVLFNIDTWLDEVKAVLVFDFFHE